MNFINIDKGFSGLNWLPRETSGASVSVKTGPGGTKDG